MASKPPVTEDGCNSETDEETLALKKKRSRRVSFADREITSVHIFKRDDDSETPPDSSTARSPISDAENEVLGFFRDLVDSDDSKEMSPTAQDEHEDDDEYDDVVNARKSFFRPIESPSPGSSIVGSATSNDEANFFGPVSASFIRPGRLSDSAASDDNHDITMDSTAFSMHYRSLARSDSGGDLKTSTDIGLATEEKTPSHITTSSDPGSFMVLTKAKKRSSQYPLAVENVSSGRDSNDMSLIGENRRSYDYGKLSPELEALLAEGSTDLHPKSLKRIEVSMFDEKGNGYRDENDSGDKEMGNAATLDVSVEGAFVASMELDEANGVSVTTLVDPITHDSSSNRTEDLAANASVDHRIQTPNQLSKGQTSNQLSKVNNDISDVVTGSSILDIELHAISGSTPPNVGSKVLQLDSFSQHESGQCSAVGWIKENSSKDGRNSCDIDQNYDQLHGSPLAGSISSLSSKRQQIFLDASKASRQLSYETPFPRQPASFSPKENIKSGEIVLSVHKSSSKFKIFEPSPLASALKDGIAKSRDKLSKFRSSATSPCNTVVNENSKDTKGKHVDVPIMNLEKHLFSIDLKTGHQGLTAYMDSYGIGTPKKTGSRSGSEGSIRLAEDPESLIHMPVLNLSKERATQLMAEVGSPSQFTWPQKKVSQHTLIQKSTEGTLVIPASDSSLLEIRLDHKNDMKTTKAPDEFVSPPLKRLDQKLSSSTEYQGSRSGDWNQQVPHDELVSIVSGQDRNAIGNVTSDSHSTALTDKSESLFAERRAQSSLPFHAINHVEDCSQVGRLDDRQSYLSEKQHVSENTEHFQTLLRERNVLNFHSGSPDRNILVATDTAHSEEELPGERNNDSPSASASLYVHRSINESSLKSPFKKELTHSPTRKELTQSPSRKRPWNASNDDNGKPLVGKVIPPPNSNSNEDGNKDSQLSLHNAQSKFPAQDVKNSYSRKRTAEEPVLGGADKIRRVKRSPNTYKSQGSNMESTREHSNESDNVKEMVGDDTTMKHWSDISLKFSADTEQLLSPLIDKLNIRAIGQLEDILVHLQKVKLFETLCSQVQSQDICDTSSKDRHLRVDETRLLLYKLVCEKARLQVLSVKREKLLKKAQQLSSAIQESQVLKSNGIWHHYLSGERDTRVDGNLHSKHEVCSEKVVTMRHEFEAVDRKIKDLTTSFHSCFKMEGEPSCSGTIFMLNDHLKKKALCRLIHEDLQLWEVEDLASKSGQQNIVLNYQGFIRQRFTINAFPSRTIFISNELNDTNIMKNFPNMDACMAFSYVLNVETTKKYVGPRSLAQETQITSSLLHNLLDVLEEVQLARLEIRNLVQTSFHSPSVEQLDLQLCFIDFNSGRKVPVTIDMTCLSCGVYPSEILLYRLQDSIAGTHKSLPESLSAEIKAAVDGLRVGCSRITRFCKRVSQVVQSLSS